MESNSERLTDLFSGGCFPIQWWQTTPQSLLKNKFQWCSSSGLAISRNGKKTSQSLVSITKCPAQTSFSWIFFIFLIIKAATAKSLQSYPTLCNPIDGSPPGSPVPGILQARTLEWVAISFSNWGELLKLLFINSLCIMQGFPGGSDSKESACNAGDLGSILGLERSPEGGHANPLQYSCLEKSHGQRRLMGHSPWGRSQKI